MLPCRASRFVHGASEMMCSVFGSVSPPRSMQSHAHSGFTTRTWNLWSSLMCRSLRPPSKRTTGENKKKRSSDRARKTWGDNRQVRQRHYNGRPNARAKVSTLLIPSAKKSQDRGFFGWVCLNRKHHTLTWPQWRLKARYERRLKDSQKAA